MNDLTYDFIVDYFKGLKENNRLSHAYLFFGRKGIGKYETAKKIAKIFNCLNMQNEPCGICSDCVQIDKSTHPDVIDISEENVPNAEEMRELIRKIYIKKFSSEYKIIIINAVDKMNVSASDAFLKTLEEPPENTIFFIITSKPNAVSRTIRSRTQKIYFAGYKEIEISEEYIQRRNQVLGPSQGFDVAFKERDDFKEDTQIVLDFLRDCIIYKQGQTDLIFNKDMEDYLSKYVSNYEMEDFTGAIKNLMGIMATSDNINLGLAKELVNNII